MKMVTFDAAKLARLRKVYNWAVSQGQESFEFEESKYLVTYAKYLIEYLEGNIEHEREQGHTDLISQSVMTDDNWAESSLSEQAEYQPKTGATCSCRKGIQRDNCPTCEGTGMVIDFKAIRDRRSN